MNEGEPKKMSLWERIRRWLDRDDEDVAGEIQKFARGLRPAEMFLKAIAQELEASLLRESFAPPGLPLCVPREFIIFLSPADDKEWLGQKRRTLVQALNQALADKVRELGGQKKADALAPTVSLRSDGTLEKGQIRVKACWEAAGPGTTLVVIPPDAGEDAGSVIDPDVTHVYVGESSPDGDPTQILLPDTPLFHVEVRRGDSREALVPISQPLIRIGRGARTIPVDLRLKDPNISRLHATLEVDVDGDYWLTSLGQNPAVVNGREVSRNERVKVLPDSRIDICSYSLSVK